MVQTRARRRVTVGTLAGSLCIAALALAWQPAVAKTLQGTGGTATGGSAGVPTPTGPPTPYIVPPAAPIITAAPETVPEASVVPDTEPATPETTETTDPPNPVGPRTAPTAAPANPSPAGPVVTSQPRLGPRAGPAVIPSALALRPTTPSTPATPSTPSTPSTTATPTTTLGPATPADAPSTTNPASLPEGLSLSPSPSPSPSTTPCPPLPGGSETPWSTRQTPFLLAGTVRGSVASPATPGVVIVFLTRAGTTDVLGVYRAETSLNGSFEATAMCPAAGIRQGEVEARFAAANQTMLSLPVAVNVMAGPALPR